MFNTDLLGTEIWTHFIQTFYDRKWPFLIGKSGKQSPLTHHLFSGQTLDEAVRARGKIEKMLHVYYFISFYMFIRSNHIFFPLLLFCYLSFSGVTCKALLYVCCGCEYIAVVTRAPHFFSTLSSVVLLLSSATFAKRFLWLLFCPRFFSQSSSCVT